MNRLAQPLFLTSALALASCQQGAGESSEVLKRMSEQCLFFSSEMKKLYPDYPQDQDLVENEMEATLPYAQDVLKSRYYPNLSKETAQKFNIDFLAYLSGFSPNHFCVALEDSKVLVDFVDAFVMDHNNYFNQPFPSHPLGEYDAARFNTVPVWKLPEVESFMGNTLHYGDFISSHPYAPQDAQVDMPFNDTVSILPYSDPEIGLHYDLLLQPETGCSVLENPNCGEMVFFARDQVGQDFTLFKGVEAVRRFLQVRGELAN